MTVTMTIPRTWQNAGREEQLRLGERYDLPEPVATALIATGAAVAVVDPPAESLPLGGGREDARREVKPFTVPETKRKAG